MKREIKFRAWDKRNKEFIASGFHVIGETTMFSIVENYCWDNRDSEIGETTMERLGEVLISEFTGLKDKNGKDIYEGDIVKNYNGYVYVVEWTESRDSEPCFGISNDPPMPEVIGNIYEDGNLL